MKTMQTINVNTNRETCSNKVKIELAKRRQNLTTIDNDVHVHTEIVTNCKWFAMASQS